MGTGLFALDMDCRLCADFRPSLGGPRKDAIRPIEASEAAVSYVR